MRDVSEGLSASDWIRTADYSLCAECCLLGVSVPAPNSVSGGCVYFPINPIDQLESLCWYLRAPAIVGCPWVKCVCSVCV